VSQYIVYNIQNIPSPWLFTVLFAKNGVTMANKVY